MTQKERVLELLRRPEGATTSDFCAAYMGASFRSRIAELKGEGLEVKRERVSKSCWRYTLPAGQSELFA
jgi:hypothetical protein